MSTTDVDAALIKQAQAGDVDARNKIIMECQPLLKMIANRVALKSRDRRTSYLESVQDGSIYLIAVIRRFDTKSGVKFTTFAYRSLWLYLHGSRITDTLIKVRHNGQTLGEAGKAARTAALDIQPFVVSQHETSRVEESPYKTDGHQQDLLEEVHRSIRTLQPNERTAILAISEGESRCEIARRMGVSASAVFNFRRTAIKHILRADEINRGRVA